MNAEGGRVTIAIPTRNRIQDLGAALESALKQSCGALDILVSDNNTSGDIQALLSRYPGARFRYFRHDRDLSMTENWNFCLEKALGEYFILLSDDDLLFPEAAEALKSALEGTGGALAYGRAVFEDGEGRKLGASSAAPAEESGPDFIRNSLAGKRQALPSFTLFRTASARALGGYPETGNSTDLALRLSLALSGPVACVDGPVGTYRLHSGSLTGDAGKTIESFGLLAGWCAKAGSPLADWQAPVRGYCAASLAARARASALRGDNKAAAAFIARASELGGGHWYDKPLLSFLSLPPVRALADLRRKTSLELLKFPGIEMSSVLITLAVFLLFAAGYQATAGKLAAGGAQYLLLNIAGAAIASFTILKLKDYDVPLPARMLFLILLIFGYFKFYWLVLAPKFAQTFFTAKVKLLFLDPESLAAAFRIQTVSFLVYCAALLGFCALGGKKKGAASLSAEKEEVPCPSAAKVFTALALFLLPVLMFLVYRYKVGVLGMPSKPLPLHLSGVIFYLQIIFLPGLLLAQIYSASRSGSPRLARAGGGLLLLWAVADAVLRTSRASLLLAPLLILFLALSGGLKLRKTEIGAVLGAGFMAVFFLPMITRYRELRMCAATSFDAIAFLLYNFSLAPRDLLGSIAFLVFRVPGVETLVLVLGFPSPVIGSGCFRVLFSGDGLSGYLTHRLMGAPAGDLSGFATSFLGGAYLCGGVPAVVIASVLAALVATYGWNALKALRLETLPVARTFFLILLFWGMTEGVSPTLFKQAAAAAVSLLAFETVMRLGRAQGFPPAGGRK